MVFAVPEFAVVPDCLGLVAVLAEAQAYRLRNRVAAAGDADFVTFRIADDGPGIPPELREEIFTAFYSTRAERSGGLGLAITRRIVARCFPEEGFMSISMAQRRSVPPPR